MKQEPKNRYWGGWISAGKKSSHILYDKAWNTEAFGPNVFIYNLLQNRIVEYVPCQLRQHVRSLHPDEYFLYSDLISNYWTTRAIFLQERSNDRQARTDDYEHPENDALEPPKKITPRDAPYQNLTAEERELNAKDFQEGLEWMRRRARERAADTRPFGDNNYIYERLIEQGLLTREEDKPEWLRGVSGSGPTECASWGPADKDGNPLPFGGE